jgi:enterochelin esterase family protein
LPFDFRLSYIFRVTHRSAGGEKTVTTHDSLNTGQQITGQSVATGPFVQPQPWLQPLPGVAKGSLRQDSIFSKILGEERTFSIYHPANAAAARGLVLILDGERFASDLPTPTTLDNLIGKTVIPPVGVAFIDTRRWSRQSDLACNREFAEFITNELLPRLRKEFGAQRSAAMVIGGASQGGLQAACTAFWYPSIFANVLSMSGSFFWYPNWPARELALSEDSGWLTSQLARGRRKNLRWFMSTGTWEGDGVWENRRLRDVLIAKGYPLTYKEVSGGHDEATWQGLIADGLIALLGRGHGH